MIIKKYLIILVVLNGFLFNSAKAFGQSPDIKVKIDDYGINQLKNKGHLCKHYVDSISRHYLNYLNIGYSERMTSTQKHLGYFYLLLEHPSVYEDGFYLVSYDSLYPVMLSACEELGFYEFVNTLTEINAHRNQKIELFQNDTTTIIFFDTNDQFDQELYGLRQKLYKLREGYTIYHSYVEPLRMYILLHNEELMLIYP